MTNQIIIKKVSRPGQDPKRFRAYRLGKWSTTLFSLGITASTTGSDDYAVRRCAVKAFIKFNEPEADADEIETRIVIREVAPDSIWEATLQPKGK